MEPMVTISMQEYDRLIAVETRSEKGYREEMLKLVTKLLQVVENNGDVTGILKVYKNTYSNYGSPT